MQRCELKMSTPYHISTNYEAVLKKIESANIDEAQKMFYRMFLDQTKESTNGRTEAEKIQDLTEAVAGLAQISISRQIDNMDFTRDVASLKNCVELLQGEIEQARGINDKVNKLEEAVKKSFVPLKPVDKILDLIKNLPWSAAVLGLGVCGLIAYRPQIIEAVKMLFFSH